MMSYEPRKSYLITTDEAELLFCFRLLKSAAQAAVIALITSQIPTERQEVDTVVRLSLVGKDHT